MSVYKYLRQGALALTLMAGLYAVANINGAVAGGTLPPSPIGPNGLFYSEQGFDFGLFDLGDGSQPFEISGPGGVFGAFPGSDGMLGLCTGCFDGTPNLLSISRSDGALFSMTGFIGGSFSGSGEGTGGVDFAVAPDPFSTPYATGTLFSDLASFEVSTPLVAELLIFSPLPFDAELLEDTDCLCFDNMSFDVAFEQDNSSFGVQTAQFGTPITVTFGGSVPEPAAWSLVGFGLAGVVLARRRRRHTAI